MVLLGLQVVVVQQKLNLYGAVPVYLLGLVRF